jgi:4-amino-4-deoxy-L-arabinose transferase-like glycosyltransferase
MHAATTPVSPKVATDKPRISNLALVVVILLVGLLFRTYDLDRVPPGLDGDEMFNGWDALRVWQGNLAVYFPANYGREPLLIYLIAVTTRLLGVGPWSMRLTSALVGMANLIFTWLLARRLFNARVAVLATGLMSVSLWPVFLSRVALRAGLQPTCQAIAVYALWRALESENKRHGYRWAVVAGLFLGLNLYTYTASRVFPLVPILWLLVLFVSRAARTTSRIAYHGLRLPHNVSRRLILAGLVAVLVMLPLIVFALEYPDTFNQRVQSLNYKFFQLQEGDLNELWRSVRAVARMFTRRGDWSWRYNPAGRPVFDKATGALFYLGLVVVLFRLRRPAYSLLVIWLLVMLLPTILSVSTPSFLRSAGAMAPIYLMPALGADFIYEQVVHHGSRRMPLVSRFARRALPVLFAIGLVLIAAATWHMHFDVWPRHPHVLRTYEADLAAAAHYLNGLDGQDLADTLVWVSSEYPGDLSRWLFDLQSTYSGPVRWFDGNHVTVWPSGRPGQDVLLLYTWSAPPNSDAVAVLNDYLVCQEDDAAGQTHLWVYRIPEERLSDVPWRPAHTLSGRFAWNRELLGYDAPAQVQRQTKASVVVYWRVPPGVVYDPVDLPFSYVCLWERTVQRCLEREGSNYNSYPIWDWMEGDLVAERYEVPVPAYLLPQTTHFRVGMFTSVGEISYADENSAGVPLLVGPVEVTGTASVDPKWGPDALTFNQELALIDFVKPSERSPGSTLEVELRWQAMRQPTRDYLVRLELREPDTGGVVTSTKVLLGGDRHPTSQWVSGEPARIFPRVRIPPDLTSGEYGVHLQVMEAEGQQVVGTQLPLGPISVSGRSHSFELPTPEYPLSAEFGTAIRLLGYDLKQANLTGGGQIEIVLYWQALGTISQDYKVFVHLYHPFIEAGLPGQHDSPPGNGAFPTSSWLPGEVVTDPHLVPIELNADPGRSKIGVGLYLPATGERLPVLVDGQPQPNDVLIITEVEIQ